MFTPQRMELLVSNPKHNVTVNIGNAHVKPGEEGWVPLYPITPPMVQFLSDQGVRALSMRAGDVVLWQAAEPQLIEHEPAPIAPPEEDSGWEVEGGFDVDEPAPAPDGWEPTGDEVEVSALDASAAEDEVEVLELATSSAADLEVRYKKPQLESIAAALGVPTYGTKLEIAERIVAAAMAQVA